MSQMPFWDPNFPKKKDKAHVFYAELLFLSLWLLQSNNENDDLISVHLQDDILNSPQGRENVRFPEKTSFVFLERHPPPGTC